MPTPTPALPSFTDGTIVRAVDLNGLSLNIGNLYTYTMGGFRTQKPECALRVTGSTQSIPTGSDTIISFDVADINTDNMYVPAQPTFMTVQTPGTYFLYAQALHQAGFSTFAVRLLINGTSSSNAVGTFGASANAGNVSALVSLAAGATIYASILQSTGSAVNLSPSLGSSRLAAFYVGP